MKMRKKILFGLLGAVLIMSLYSIVETKLFEQQLQIDADRLVEEMKADVKMDVKGNPQHDVTSVVIASREFGYFGEPLGKITVYFRNNQMMESVPNIDNNYTHHTSGKYTGVTYFYDKRTDGWVNTESSLCSAEECQIPGKAAFEQAGL